VKDGRGSLDGTVRENQMLLRKCKKFSMLVFIMGSGAVEGVSEVGSS
jgi:hypothetical protein